LTSEQQGREQTRGSECGNECGKHADYYSFTNQRSNFTQAAKQAGNSLDLRIGGSFASGSLE
jgi:hypothetical protein